MNMGPVRKPVLTWAAPRTGDAPPTRAWPGPLWDASGLALAFLLLTAGAGSAANLPRAAVADAASDLVITMTASPLSVPVGGEIQYRIAVTNQGPNLAPDVVVTDPLPPGLEFIAASASRGHAELSQRTLLADLGAIDVGDSAVVTLVTAATVAGEFRNTAAVHSDNPDPNLDNNAATFPASAGPPPPSPPSPPPASPCAADQTGAVKLIPGLLEYNSNTRQFHQQVRVANISKQPLAGPVWLVLDGLAPVALLNADGLTSCRAPFGSPYLQINVGADGVLQPQEVVTTTLSFMIPAGHGLIYQPRVLTGTGER